MLTREMGAWQCVSVAKGTEGFKIDGGYLGEEKAPHRSLKEASLKEAVEFCGGRGATRVKKDMAL